MPRLIVEEGMQKGREFRFSAEAAVGRGKDNLVTVEDPRVSLRHAKIVLENGQYVLKDLASRNGTFVNGERVTETPLGFGDKVKVGALTLSFAEDPKGKWAGRTLAGYELLDIAGEGGMGTVYKARQVSLDRVVALKLIHERLMKDPKYVERFLAEAKAAAILNHPGIVQVHDVGSEEGTYFFSMEYVDGTTLAERLQKGPALTIPEAVDVVRKIAEALAYAHSQGIVHRDVKPENILLAADGQVKLADLGVAKQSRTIESAEPGPDGKRILVGTPAYIAPEEILGKGSGPATDIYALGATFYQILAGRLPFISASPMEMLRMHVANTPPDIRRYNPEVSPELCQVVFRMMAKDPRDRFSGAREVVETLKRTTLAGRPVTGRPSSGIWVWIAAAVLAVGIALWAFFRPHSGGTPRSDVLEAPQSGEDPQELYQKATDLHQAGHYEEAEALYQKVIDRTPATLWTGLAEDAIRRLRENKESARLERLRQAYDRILRESSGDLATLYERLSAFRAECVGTSLAKTVDTEFERASRRLDQERRLAENQKSEEEALERAFQEGIGRINTDLGSGRFSAAWSTLETLHASHGKLRWKDQVATMRKRLIDRMNQHLREERLEWENLKERKRYAEGWRRTQGLERTLAGTPLEAQASLARQRVASELTALFAADAAPADAMVRSFRFRETAETIKLLADAYAGTPCEEQALQALQVPRMLADMHATTVEKIKATPSEERKSFPQDPGRPRARVIDADEAGLTFESVPGAGTASVRWQKPWAQLPPQQAYAIYDAHLDKRKRQSHEWLLAFCTQFELAEEAQNHIDRLGGPK